MLISRLRLRHFRNLSQVEVALNERFNIFAGANGQGKTNLLEAIYLLGAIKSFRPSTNAQLIEFGEPLATLEARVDRGGSDRIVRIEIHERGKRVFLNNTPVKNLGDFFGTINVVMFGPEDINLLRGSPGERRRFLDRAIFNAHPAYAMEVSQYEETLKQRNALLKTPGGPDRALLSVYDEQLVGYGADLLERRLDFVRRYRPVLQRTFAEIFGEERMEADIGYEVKWADGLLEEVPDEESLVGDRDAIEALLQRGLQLARSSELDRGHTLVGPHRDELASSIGGLEVRSFASQGQNRAFVLAMKIAEIDYLEERYHFAPILLLDDVSSELDRARNRYLFDYLRRREEGQVFITTTHRDYILLDRDVSVWNVAGGELRPSEGPPAERAAQDLEEQGGADAQEDEGR